MIEQVIMNLVLNAVQSLQKGGHVSLETRKHEEVCEIVVEDNGCGIASNVRPHIFDPFFTTKGYRGGDGVGIVGEFRNCATAWR